MADIAAVVSRLEAVTARLEGLAARGGAGGAAPAAGGAASSGPAAPFVEAFDELIDGPLKKYLDLANEIGGDVKTHADSVQKAFAAQRVFLEIASKAKEPAPAVLQGLLKETSTHIGAVQEFREKARKTTQPHQLATIAEGVPALGWVTVTPKPVPFVDEMYNASQFWANRVIKDFKDTDKKQVELVRAFGETLKELSAYVKKFHTTGVAWNKNGVDASTVSASAPAASAPAAGGPPPPPAGAPSAEALRAAALAASPAASAPKAGGGGLSDVFNALNKGEGVTSGLRKVDKSEMTHKNPALRASSVVKAKEDDGKPKTSAPAAAAAKKMPPRLELEDGKRWAIEYQDGNKSIVIDDTNAKQAVYIYKCVNSTVVVKGKVNCITMDSCKKTAVVFDACVAVFETVNCQSVQAQVTGRVPTISIDKTDGVQVYLSREGLDVEIVTAKSSEMNISVPAADKDGEFMEFPIPEQFKSTWNGTKIATHIVEHAAG